MEILKSAQNDYKKFHELSNSKDYIEELEKKIHVLNDHRRVYLEQVEAFHKEIKKFKDNMFLSESDKLALYFRHYFFVKHGLLIADNYYLGAINCYDAFLTSSNPYIHLKNRNGDYIVFIDIEKFSGLPIYAKDSMWKLAVKDGITISSKEDFVNQEFATAIKDRLSKNREPRIDFLSKWEFLDNQLNRNSSSRNYNFEIFNNIDGNFLVIYPHSAIM